MNTDLRELAQANELRHVPFGNLLNQSRFYMLSEIA